MTGRMPISRYKNRYWSFQFPITINHFKGLNLREDPGVLSDTDLSSCINFDLGRAGELKKRTGLEQLHNGSTLGPNSVKLIGHYSSGIYNQIIAQVGTQLYYSNDGINWTLIGTYTVEFGVQYADKFLMVRKGATVLVWSGTGTPAAVTGSPGGDFCIIHKERLFVFDSSGTGQPNSRLYFSAVTAGGTPQTPDLAAAWISTNFIDIKPGDGDFLTCCAIVHDLLLVFKTRTTWGLYVQGASTGDWTVRNMNPRIGCVSKYTPRDIEGLIYFVSATGIYKTDGTTFTSVSDSIQPVLKDRVVNLTNANVDCAIFWNDIYLVLLQPVPGTARYFAYYIRAGGWTEWQVSGGYKPSYFLDIRANVPATGVYMGDMNASGNIFRYGNNVFTDIGLPYVSSLATKDLDIGYPGIMKRGKWMGLDTLGAAVISVSHVINSVEGLTTLANSGVLSNMNKAVGPGYFRTWTFKMSAAGNAPFTFFGFTMYMHRKTTVIGART